MSHPVHEKKTAEEWEKWKRRTSSSTSPSFTSVTISSVMSSPSPSPSQNGSSSDVSMIEGDSRLADVCRLRGTLGLFLTVRPGVLALLGVAAALLGVTFGDGFVGVRWGFEGVVFGVASVVAFASQGGEAAPLLAASPGERTGDFPFGVDMVRVRGVGEILAFTFVSDSDV